MPAEILLGIVANMDAATRIGLAQASPVHFLNANFNVYVQEAQFQIQLQNTPPVTETDETRPLLLWAIENGAGVDVLDQIITAYQQVNPDQWGDSIWGPLSRELPTPLWMAIRVGRADVVDLLLRRGVNPRTRYCPVYFGSCTRQGYPHHECLRLHENPHPAGHCYNALEYAVWALSLYVNPREARQAVVRRLIEEGERFELLNPRGTSISLFFEWASWNDLDDVLIFMMDEILALPDTDPRRVQLQAAVDQMFYVVATTLNRDGQHNALIAYFIGLGAPAGYPISDVYDVCRIQERWISMAACRTALEARGAQNGQ